MRLRFGLLSFLLLSFPLGAQAQNNTPDYWHCTNRVGGSWIFGQAPSACDASSFGLDEFVWSRFAPQVFHVTTTAAAETSRYMTEMYAVLRDAAGFYLRRRKPRATAIEVVMFRRAIFALAHQESYWTHYRVGADQRLKLMRGDSGHGHGLMQIDDRWHFAKVEQGEAWDLTGNILHAMELYYSEWERALRASCLTRAQDYEARARAAYSAYNGGSAQICRWTNPASTWARNDTGFFDKLRGMDWDDAVTTTRQKASFDVGCDLESGNGCFEGSTK